MNLPFISNDPRAAVNAERPPYPHQTYSTNFYRNRYIKWLSQEDRAGVLNFSECGTGKTRTVLDFLYDLKMAGQLPPVLVFGTLSILQPAWGNDTNEWTPGLGYSIAYAKNREAAFKIDADMHITNHDAIKWMMRSENRDIVRKFTNGIVIIDEFTAFKNPTSQRSKAIKQFIELTDPFVIQLSGTPMPRTVLDVWHPAFLADWGNRLGKSYYRFRSQMCVGKQVGPDPNMMQWEDREEAPELVADMLSDISLRFEAQNVPKNTKRFIYIELPKRALKAYQDMVDSDVMYAEDGSPVSAVHAAARYRKLLQLCTGAVYDEGGVARTFHKERYELVVTLAAEVRHSVIGFNWRHERDALAEILTKKGMTFAIIDGTVSNPATRSQIVKDYQAGKYDTLLCHPQSAGHGLTFTKGTRTIWASATENAEYFLQFNKRIDRLGQQEETETIMVCAVDTKEAAVYDAMLNRKVKNQSSLLSLFSAMTKIDEKTQ